MREDTIRLVPYWNVKESVKNFLNGCEDIRLVPYWNVKSS